MISNIFSKISNNIKKEKLLSVSNFFVMFVTLLLLGVFTFVVAGAQTALRYLEQQAQITVFFKDDFTEDNIIKFKQQLEGDPRIDEVRYISKEEAFKIFTEMNKDEPILLESITAGVLPASIEVRAYDIRDLSGLSEELSKVDGVEEVRFFKDIIEKFRFWSSVVYIIGFALIAIFLLISYSVIISSLRTTITSKGVEFEIMKLVGASNNYVVKPLLYQALVFGISSAAFASLIILLVGIFLARVNLFSYGIALGFLPGVFISLPLFTFLVILLLMLSGCLLGFLGSRNAVKKYLKY